MQQLLTSSLSVQRPAYTQDAAGGMVQTTTTVFSGVLCRIQPASGSVVQIYSQRNLRVTHRGYTTTVLALKDGDIITCNGSTFKVVGFSDFDLQNRIFFIDMETYIGGSN